MRGDQWHNSRHGQVPTPYRVMRVQNCKTYPYQSKEGYPSIRPPISKCKHRKTTQWMSEAMEQVGCHKVDQDWIEESLENPYSKPLTTSLYKVPNQNFNSYCKNRKLYTKKTRNRKKPPHDWNKLTPYDLVRLQNCKLYDFNECESYPSVRPPHFKCSAEMTANWLYDAAEDVGCEFIDMDKADVLEIWKRSPRKKTLSFYGVGSLKRPEVAAFNRVVTKCLKIANKPKPKQPSNIDSYPVRPVTALEPTLPPIRLELPTRPRRSSYPRFVLNQTCLAEKVKNMPTVQKYTDSKSAIGWKYCRRCRSKLPPFVDPPSKVIKKEETELKPPTDEQIYCELQCGIPENACTDYEWKKYVDDPAVYNEAFKEEMKQQMKAKSEPKDYEELYDELITCFEKKTSDPLLTTLIECCPDYAQAITDGGWPGGHGGDGDGKGGRGDKGDESDEDDDGKDGKDGKDGGTSDGDGDNDDKDGKDGDGDGDGGKGDGLDGDGGKGGKGGKGDKGDDDGKGGKGDGGGKGGKGGKGDGKDKKDGKGGDGGKGGKGDGLDDGHEGGKGGDGGEGGDGSEGGKGGEGDDAEGGGDGKGGKGKGKLKRRGKDKGKDKGRGKRKDKGDKGETYDTNVPDCPCPYCKFKKKRGLEPDTPLITKLKREEERRKLKEYLKIMCYREYIKRCGPEYRAPVRKCEDIDCSTCFCRNPKLGEYCECLNALQHLMKLVPANNCPALQNLKDRICTRLCECL